MGWFLWRKPYPGFTGDEQIPLATSEVFLGRGKECTVHCLSLYVSRKHLRVIPKEDGSLSLQDLGSSNGTFVNEKKIPPNIEVPINIGDEIGIGNIANDNKDCFVYEVRNNKLSENKLNLPTKVEDSGPDNIPLKDELVDVKHHPQHGLERGLKRCADEPEIVVLDDDEEENGNNSNGIVVESSSNSSKRLKTEHNPQTLLEPCHESNPISLKLESAKEREQLACVSSSVPEGISQPSVSSPCVGVGVSSTTNEVSKPPKWPQTEAHTAHHRQDTSSIINNIDSKCDGIFPMPSGRVPTAISVKPEIILPKPTHQQISTILEGSCDMSSGTIRLSSSNSTIAQSSRPVICSTPLHNKHLKLEDSAGLPTTPCVIKNEDDEPSTSRSGADWSPIVKDSSRLSQGSSANYTIDEEMIPICLSEDDDDEIFPCSQMFAEEEDVKPSRETLDKDMGIIDLSGEEEDQQQSNVPERDDDVVLISDDEDEDEEEIQEVNRWLNRLSQSFIKVEVEEEPPKEDIVSSDLPLEPHDNDLWEDWPKISEANDKGKEHVGTGLLEMEVNLAEVVEDDLAADHTEDVKAVVKPEKKTHRKERKEKHKHKDSKALSDKRHKQRSREQTEKHSSHRKHHGEKKDSRGKEKEIVRRLKEAFNSSSSEDEAKDARVSSVLKDKPKERTQSDINFDALLNKPDERLNLSGEGRLLHVHLDRLEENSRLCEQYGLSSSLSPTPPVQPPPAPVQKKAPRRIEIVDALPNPPRKASNRGISMETTQKMYDNVKRRSIDEPKRPKSKADSKAMRKEKLAKVAAHVGSKDKGSAEHKRSAPAKAKVTMANRGTFLTETDESSPITKPKSRKEILDSIKIPKLKDKAVINLPTKSPLQALNMSWEKESTPSVTAPSNAEPSPIEIPTGPQPKKQSPIEIPTGPQPKKRVAQKPPPGFYDELSKEQPSSLGEELRVVPESSVSIKSCLSGSSKHNISMNSTRPSAPKKKTVQFKDPIVQIKYIDRLPNTRPVRSARDADRPAPIHTPPKLPKGPTMPNDESLLQDVIYDISKWNPLWLKEEKDLPADVAPPVVSNMEMPALPKTEFLDFAEYYKTMYPLLMLELWNGVSKEFNTRMNDTRNNLIMAVDSACSALVVGRPDRTITTLACHMLADDRVGVEHPRLGNLVIIDLALKDPAGKLVICPVFGYVSFDTKDRLRNSDIFHKDLVSHCRNPVFKIRFNLQIRERKNFPLVLERPMRIKHVKYVRGDLRMFQAMKNLEYTPLQYSVISPMAASEDFTLPDVSQKNLAFSEQLNPMQKQIVLQTAEVCLQDKPKICLIQGPPGTGKTHVIESLVMHLLYRDRMYSRANRERGLVPRILLCAPSNNAVDLLVARLLRRRAKLEKEHRFKMVRVGQTNHEDVRGVSLQELTNVSMKQDRAMNDTQSIEIDMGHLTAKLCAVENQISDLHMNSKPVPPEVISRQADIVRRLKVLEGRKKQQQQASTTSFKPDFAFERETKKKILRGADIIGTTLNSCVVKVMETVFPPTSAGKYHFQVCIVDEATQCLEVETLIPLLVGVKTLVLVGDPNQLPATILSKIAREKGLGTSLFARLQNVVPKAVQMLDTQYRMHPEILKWPNKYFYQRRLKCPEQILSCRDSRILPYTVLSLPFQQDLRGESNTDEAKLILQLAELLIDERVIQHDFRVGIVTPYQNQRRIIESMMARNPRPNKPVVEVNTIDSCQGQEKDIIIISCVRTNGVGFLSDRQRVNVALTRAKYAMFICGNFSSLDRDSMWNNLLADARHRNCLIEIRDHSNKDQLWSLISKK